MGSTIEPSYMSLGVLATASVLLEPSRPPLDMHNKVIKVQIPNEDLKEAAIREMIKLVREEEELAVKDSHPEKDVLEIRLLWNLFGLSELSNGVTNNVDVRL